MTRTKKRRPGLSQLLILSGVVLLLFTGVTAARYITQNGRNGLIEAQDFYFTSNLLKDSGEEAVYFIDPQAGSFQVALYNYADSRRVTQVPITFETKVTGGSADSAKGELNGNGTDQAVVTITPDGNAGEVIVTVESKKPYKKVLTAKFKRELGNQFKVEDGTDRMAATLTMICTDSSQDITIVLPSGVIPDYNDSRVTSYTDNTCIYKSPGEGIYSLILLKKDMATKLTGTENGKFANKITIETMK